MSITRIFLDWQGPFLPKVVARLSEQSEALSKTQSRSESVLDLRNMIVVLPTKSSERRLIELLVEEAENRGVILLPPQRCSVAALPELFYTPRHPLASNAQKKIAWLTAIDSVPPTTISKLFPNGVDTETAVSNISLANTLNQLWSSDLGPSLLSCKDVPDLSGGLMPDSEIRRWLGIEELFQKYLEVLDQLGLADTDYERSQALQSDIKTREEDIILLGTADLKQVAEQFLQKTKSQVYSYVNAPEAMANFFTHLGTLANEKWSEHQISVPDSSIRYAASPLAQSEVLLELIAESSKDLEIEDISIGTADESLIDSFQASCSPHQLRIRSAAGKPVTETQVVSLLRAIFSYEETASYLDFGTALRHPDIYRTISSQLESDIGPILLQDIDRYHRNHLQQTVQLDVLPDGEKKERFRSIHEILCQLLPQSQGQKKSLRFWCDYVLSLLGRVYTENVSSRRHELQTELQESCLMCKQLLEELLAMDEMSTIFDASNFFELFLSLLSEKSVPNPVESNALNANGWLELQLTDAEACFVTSMNEGVVPASMSEDMFLPNSLRSKLKLVDNQHRFVRDCYILESLLSNIDRVTLIASTRNAAGEPSMPSRLLLSLPTDQLASRVLRFYASDATAVRAAPHGASHAGGSDSNDLHQASFPIAAREPAPLAKPIGSMNVTSFRDYLTCPYRFYLRHVLRLNSVDDLNLEMDPATFGTLAHDILADFANVTIKKRLLKVSDIHQAIERSFKRRVAQRFGDTNMIAAVRVQLKSLQLRLEKFAEWQAKRQEEGWNIMHSELGFSPEDYKIKLADGSEIGLSGRIDRIDYNPSEGIWEIFDYKTIDQDRRCHPESTHRDQNDNWLDVQLPLYRYLLRASGVEGTIRTGYIALPQEAEAIGARLAEWTDSEYIEAEEVAASVAMAVRQNVFWPATEMDPTRDSLSEICSGYLNHWK